MANALALARLMQRLLVRATDKEIDTAGKLVEESIAALTLRRSF
jgi:DNA polymerase-3 subunit epsilon